ncbi:MAG: hypothetical protein WBD40_02580 [Tepidisphaeraceae bacterium]
MIGKRGVAVAALVGSLLGAAACAPKKEPTMSPTVEQGDAMPRPQTAEARVEQLGEAVNEFAAARKKLSGHSDETSRGDLADALGELQDVLTLLEDPDPRGAFRQQMRIIERARTQLTSGSSTAPEPTINAAIRAADNALVNIKSEQFPDDEPIGKLLAALNARVGELDTVRGPLHGFVTAQALDDAGRVVEAMANIVEGRMPKESPATAPAATAPAANPA